MRVTAAQGWLFPAGKTDAGWNEMLALSVPFCYVVRNGNHSRLSEQHKCPQPLDLTSSFLGSVTAWQLAGQATVTSTSDTDGDKGHFLPQSPKSVGELESLDRVLRVAQPLHSGGRENRRTMVGWKCLPQEQLTLGQALGSFQQKTPLGLRVLRTSWACCTHPARTVI